MWAGYFLSSNLKDTVWKQTFLLIRKLAYDDHKLYYCEKRDEKEISNNDVPGQDTFMIEQTWYYALSGFLQSISTLTNRCVSVVAPLMFHNVLL